MDLCVAGLTSSANVFYGAFRRSLVRFSVASPAGLESLSVIRSSDGASELIREEASAHVVGFVDGALAKIEVVEAIVNIIKNQMFIDSLE